MGIPGTLAGIVGFIIFVIFMIGISASDIYPDETQKIIAAQTDFQQKLNSSQNQSIVNVGFWGSVFGTVGLDGVYDFLTNYFSMLTSFIIMVVQYLLLFVGISMSLPAEFYVFFALLSSGLIIAIIKLVFLSGD